MVRLRSRQEWHLIVILQSYLDKTISTRVLCVFEIAYAEPLVAIVNCVELVMALIAYGTFAPLPCKVIMTLKK